MKLVFAMSMLVALAYLGAIYLFGRRGGGLSFFTGGVEYLLVGTAIGSVGIAGIDRETMRDLFPFVHIELGWIGLLYGIQLDWRHLRRHSAADWRVMGAESGIAMMAAFGAAFLGMRWLFPMVDGALAGAVLLGAAASLSSPWAVGMVGNAVGIQPALLRKLRFLSAIDDGPGLAIFGLLFLASVSAGWGDALARFAAMAAAGILLGWFVRIALRRVGADSDPLIILLGIVLLAAGTAFHLGVTAMLIAVIAGVVIVNARPRVRDIYPLVVSAEHPFYLLFLILAGALWDPVDWRSLLLAIIVALVRLSGKWAGLEVTKGQFPRLKPNWGGHLAPALLSPGGISVAMVVNFALFADRFPAAPVVLNTTVWALVILNPLGVTLARFALKRAGMAI